MKDKCSCGAGKCLQPKWKTGVRTHDHLTGSDHSTCGTLIGKPCVKEKPAGDGEEDSLGSSLKSWLRIAASGGNVDREIYAYIRTLQEKVVRLEEENQSLAAWQCKFTDGKTGLYGDEFGHQNCAQEERAEKAEEKVKDLFSGQQSYIALRNMMGSKTYMDCVDWIHKAEKAKAQLAGVVGYATKPIPNTSPTYCRLCNHNLSVGHFTGCPLSSLPDSIKGQVLVDEEAAGTIARLSFKSVMRNEAKRIESLQDENDQLKEKARKWDALPSQLGWCIEPDEITPEMIGEVNGKAWEQFECEGCKLDFPVEDGALCKGCHTASQVEMDKLKRSDSLLGNSATALGEKWTETAQQNKSLQAENEKLRGGLTAIWLKIKAILDPGHPMAVGTERNYLEISKIVQAALEAKP